MEFFEINLASFEEGFFGIFVLTFMEKLIPVIPSYLMLILIGSLFGDETSLCTAIMVSVAGSLAGSLILYSAGMLMGGQKVKGIFIKYGKYIFISHERYDRMVNLYAKNSFIYTFSGQFIPVVRVYLAVPAGFMRVNPVEFLLPCLAGIFVYNATLMTMGYMFKGSYNFLFF